MSTFGANPGLSLGIHIVASRIQRDHSPEELGSMELERLARQCFRSACADTWWTVTDDERFRIGCGALLVVLKDRAGDRFKVESSVRALRALSAAFSGVPVRLDVALPDDPDDVVPLLVWYRDEAQT